MAGDRYRFVSAEPLLTLPGGDKLNLSLQAWLALRSVLRLLPAHPAPEADVVALTRPVAAVVHPNRGRAWSADDEARCAAAWTAGDDPREIGLAVGRTRAAVLARLVRLGLLDEAAAGLRFPAGARIERGVAAVGSSEMAPASD